METKKTVTITIIATLTAMIVFTLVIVLMGTNSWAASASDHGYYPITPQEDNMPNYEDIYLYNDDLVGCNLDVILGSQQDYHENTHYQEEANEETNEEPPFTPIFKREPLPEHIIEQITGVTFHDHTPFGHYFLTYLTVTHVNFAGESTIGHLIVADSLGDEVLEIFQEIYESGFPIYSIRLIDYFDASDQLSMAANNSHAFNYRYIAGTTTISQHGLGRAIDINPIQNPYIRGTTIWPAAGEAYLDRAYVRPGMIVPGDAVYTAFRSRGWTWGGN